MKKSGFSNNQHVSPLDLNALPSQETYNTIYKEQFPSFNGRQRVLPNNTCLERSGYWSNATDVRMGLTDKQEKTYRSQQQTLNDIEIARLKRKNPIEAEHDGLGPEWGDTSYNVAHSASRKNRKDDFLAMNKNLIGPKKNTGYSYDEPMNSSINRDKSMYQTAAQRDFKSPSPRSKLPETFKVRMEYTSYSRETVTSIGDRQAKLDTSGYFCKQQQVPQRPKRFSPRKISTGYMKNETLTVGPPGDPRTFVTGRTIAKQMFDTKNLI